LTTKATNRAVTRPPSRAKLVHELERRELLRDLLSITTEGPEEQSRVLDHALTYAMENGALGETGSIFVTIPAGTSQSLQLLLRKIKKKGGGLETLRTASEYRLFAAGEGFAGTALATGKAIFSNNPTKHPAYKPFEHRAQLQSLACVPVKVGEIVLGVISLHNGSHGISGDDVSFIQDLARVSALSIRAFHHEMTMLPSRALFNELLDREIEARDSGGPTTPLALAYVDLDNFGAMNKDYSHDVGDQAIRELSRRLRLAIGLPSILCHLHGDEFAVIFKDQDAQDASALCETLREAVCSSPFDLVVHGQAATVSLSASIGGVRWSAGMNRQALIESADMASQSAKDKGRNRVEWV